MRKVLLKCVIACSVLTGCKPGTPSEYIQPDDMEDILVDYHLARAMAETQGPHGSFEDDNYRQALYIEAALQKHGVTKAEFDSSLVYYYRRADRFEEVYRHVADRLEEQALVLGAKEGEIGKYSSLNATGDTANIWTDRTMLALTPIPPYNHWDFSFEADSTYREGDSFLFQFMSDFTYQDGTRSGLLYVAITYDNDTTIGKYMHFSSAGITQLRIPALGGRSVKRLSGYLYAGSNNAERSTTTRILFINNIQLIRFHQKRNEDETKKDSSSSGRDGGLLDIDTISSGNLKRRSTEVLSLDSGATIH